MLRFLLAHTDKPLLASAPRRRAQLCEASIWRHDVTLCQADRRQRLEVIVGLSRLAHSHFGVHDH
jgi:hypothetical protein